MSGARCVVRAFHGDKLNNLARASHLALSGFSLLFSGLRAAASADGDYKRTADDAED